MHSSQLHSSATPELAKSFIKRISNPWLFKLYLLRKLPAGFRSGLRLDHLDLEKATASVPYKRFTQNPFRSTYFACLSMAAELSTGILAMMAVHETSPSVSMLITGMDAEFVKKATSRTFFTCETASLIFEAVQKAKSTGEAIAVTVPTVGRNEKGEVIARFHFEWSFKSRAH